MSQSNKNDIPVKQGAALIVSSFNSTRAVTLLLCWAASPARPLGSRVREQGCSQTRFSDLKISYRFPGKN